jgi:hypothetical protein
MRRRWLVGMVVCASGAAAQQPASSQPAALPAPYATVVGGVIDSIDGRPLDGAIVIVDGTPRQAIVDSTGRFRIDSIPPGDHALGVFHPLLDSLNLSVASKNLTFTAGGTTAVILATPSASSLIAMYCSDADRQRGPAAVIGRVLATDSDDPIKDATVRYTSVSIVVSKDVGLKHNTYTNVAKVSPSGLFTMCGLPTTSGGSVRAVLGEFVTGDVIADVSRRLVAVVTLRLDTLKTGTAVLVGRIVDEKGGPVAHVDVGLAGSRVTTTTSDSGTFAIRDIAAGSQRLEIRKVGFTAIDTALVLTAKTPTHFSMVLHSAPPTLTPIMIAAARKAALERVGFDHRMKTGQGYYLTEDRIRNSGAVVFSDIARTIPGLTVSEMRNGQTVVLQGRGTTVYNRGCVSYLIDGTPWQDVPRGSINTFVHMNDVIAMEVYQPSEMPADFVPGTNTSCAVVVIWTRATSIQ